MFTPTDPWGFMVPPDCGQKRTQGPHVFVFFFGRFEVCNVTISKVKEALFGKTYLYFFLNYLYVELFFHYIFS